MIEMIFLGLFALFALIGVAAVVCVVLCDYDDETCNAPYACPHCPETQGSAE